MSFILSFLGAALARAGEGYHVREILEEVRGQVEAGAALSITPALKEKTVGAKNG
jgi:hypothetical protein